MLTTARPPAAGKAAPELRFEETVEAFGPQTSFEFIVARPEPSIQMQRQSDEGRVLWVHVPAQTARLHPSADGNAAFFHEMDPGQQFVETFQQILLPQFRGLCDPLLVLEKLDENEAWAVERRCVVRQESLPQGGFSAQEQGEENVGVNDDLGRTHLAPSGAKRPSFACHQSDLMSSDNFQAASGVSRLRRTTLSTRSHETKSLTSPGVMPVVGMVTCRRSCSALTAIMGRGYNAKAGLSKLGLPTSVARRDVGQRAPEVGGGFPTAATPAVPAFLLAVLFLLSALLARADILIVTNESAAFTLNTRPVGSDETLTALVVRAESAPFTMDTRLAPAASPPDMKESSAFTLDTRLSSISGTASLPSVTESSAFTLDTRFQSETAGLLVSVASPAFTLNTRLLSDNPLLAALVTQTASDLFTLDTRLPAENPIYALLTVRAEFGPFTLDTQSGSFKTPAQTLTGGTTGGKVRFSPDGLRLAKTDGSRVLLWNLQSTRSNSVFNGHASTVASVEFSPLGDQLLTGSADGTFRWWDTASRAQLGRTNPPGAGTVYAAYASDGARILAGRGGNVALYRGSTMELLREFSGSEGLVTAVALAPEGLALAGNSARSAAVWDTTTGTLLHRFPNHAGLITAAAFLPGGTNAMTASLDGTIRIWDMASGTELVTIQQRSPVGDAALSIDGRVIASCDTGNPGTACLWDASSGALMRVFADASRDASQIKGVALSPDHTALATTHVDGSVRLWNTGLTPQPIYPITPLPVGSNAPVTLRSHGLYYFAVDAEAGRSLVVTLEADTGGGSTGIPAGLTPGKMKAGAQTPSALSSDAEFANLGAPTFLSASANELAGKNAGAPARKSLQTPPPGADITAFRMTATKGKLPSEYDYEAFAQASVTNLHCELPLALTSTGKVYVLVFSPVLAAGSINARISAAYDDFHLSSVTPNRGGNSGNVTVKIQGTGLTADTVASLVNPAGGTNVGVQVLLADSTAMFVTFNLTGASVGSYHLQIGKPGVSPVAVWNGFEVLPGGGARLQMSLSAPENIRAGREYVAYLEIGNTGDTDLELPLVLLEARGCQAVRLLQNGENLSNHVALLIPPQESALPVYPPGESLQIPIFLTAGASDIQLQISATPIAAPALQATILDYSLIQCPAGVAPAVWDSYLQELEAQQGTNLTQFYQTILHGLLDQASPSLYSLTINTDGRWLRVPRMADKWEPRLPVPLLPGFGDAPQKATLRSRVSARSSTRPPDGIQKTWVIIVSDDDYSILRNEEKNRGYADKDLTPDLPGITKAGDLMRQRFEHHGVPPGQIVLLQDRLVGDDDLGPAEVSSAIEGLPCDADDTVVVYYSGHGDENGNIVLNKGTVTADALAGDLAATGAENIIVLADSCFSGKLIADMDKKLDNFRGESSTGTSSYAFGGNDGGAWTQTLLHEEQMGKSHSAAELEARLFICCYFSKNQAPSNQCPEVVQQDEVDVDHLQGFAKHDPLADTRSKDDLDSAIKRSAVAQVAKTLRIVRPVDPNEKVGPAGIGPNRVVSTNESLEYLVRFENLASASAPVQELVLVDYLDSNFDWTSVQLEELAYGDRLISVPPGSQFYSLRDSPPLGSPSLTGADAAHMAVDVNAAFNAQIGRLECRLRAVDTNSGVFPVDALSGFLPPEDGSGRGQGHLRFTVKAKPTAPLGAGLTNVATIVFDGNDPIDTAPVWNTIGDVPSLAATIAYLPGQITVGTPFTYTIGLTNTGTNAVGSVVLTNTLPAGLNILTTTATLGIVTVTNGVLIWNLGTLTNGVGPTLTITASPTQPGTFATTLFFSGGSGLAIFTTPGEITVLPSLHPSLTIRVLGATVELAWPTNNPGFRLQRSAVLSPSLAWENIMNSPATEGAEFRLQLTPTNATEFYRLSNP